MHEEVSDEFVIVGSVAGGHGNSMSAGGVLELVEGMSDEVFELVAGWCGRSGEAWGEFDLGGSERWREVRYYIFEQLGRDYELRGAKQRLSELYDLVGQRRPVVLDAAAGTSFEVHSLFEIMATVAVLQHCRDQVTDNRAADEWLIWAVGLADVVMGEIDVLVKRSSDQPVAIEMATALVGDWGGSAEDLFTCCRACGSLALAGHD